MNGQGSQHDYLKSQIELYRIQRQKRLRKFIVGGAVLFMLVASGIVAYFQLGGSGASIKTYSLEELANLYPEDLFDAKTRQIVIMDADQAADTLENAQQLRELMTLYGIQPAAQSSRSGEVETVSDNDQEEQYPSGQDDIYIDSPPSNEVSTPLVLPGEQVFRISGNLEVDNRIKIELLAYDPETTYQLDLGNGNTRTIQRSTTFVYNESGIYTLALSAEKDNQTEYYASQIIKIAPKELASPPRQQPKLASNQPATPVQQVRSDPASAQPQQKAVETFPQVTPSEPSVSQAANTPTRTEEEKQLDKAPPAEEVPFPQVPASGQEQAPQEESSTPLQPTSTIDQVQATPPAEASRPKVDPSTFPLELAEVMPSYPGGPTAMAQFVNSRIRYPQAARDHQIEGKVYVQFVVSATGRIENPKVVRSLGYGCDNEALRLVQNMPNWVPGEQFGQRVPVIYTIPIDFKLIDR